MLDAEDRTVRERLRRQERVRRHLDAEAKQRGFAVSGLRPSYAMRLFDYGVQDVIDVLGDIEEANEEIERLSGGVRERMALLREFEEIAVVIDRARGRGGRGW